MSSCGRHFPASFTRVRLPFQRSESVTLATLLCYTYIKNMSDWHETPQAFNKYTPVSNPQASNKSTQRARHSRSLPYLSTHIDHTHHPHSTNHHLSSYHGLCSVLTILLAPRFQIEPPSQRDLPYRQTLEMATIHQATIAAKHTQGALVERCWFFEAGSRVSVMSRHKISMERGGPGNCSYSQSL